jgi:hypothetical protein
LRDERAVIMVRLVPSLRTRLVLLAFGVLLALGARPASPDLTNGATASIGVAHAEPSSPVVLAVAAPRLQAPQPIDWQIVAPLALVGNCSTVSLYLRDCALRL